jgi:hypothetical protein
MLWHLPQLDVIIISLCYSLHSLVSSSRFHSTRGFVANSASDNTEPFVIEG